MLCELQEKKILQFLSLISKMHDSKPKEVESMCDIVTLRDLPTNIYHFHIINHFILIVKEIYGIKNREEEDKINEYKKFYLSKSNIKLYSFTFRNLCHYNKSYSPHKSC